MPNSIVKAFADQTGLSVDEVEKMWQKAEEIVKTDYEKVGKDDEEYFPLIVSVLKKMLKIENMTTTTTVGGSVDGVPNNQAHIYKKRINFTDDERSIKVESAYEFLHRKLVGF